MLEVLKLFPPYLIVLTITCVIVPAIAAGLIRISLYKHLTDLTNKVERLLTPTQSRGLQPKIVEKLEQRFKEASYQLEQVNTGALIDGVYSQDKFTFLGFSLRCEQWDYFCKVLPNLLLAFGLLGTFLGITTNLYNLSQTIYQVDGEIDNFVQQLQQPLQSMGIAFITSLVALLFSSILTVVNLRCNTTLAKYLLISSLEDYLDNILKPSIEGDTRLDKAVNRMVDQQNEFLTRFHEKVGKVLEDTLGRAANKIVDEHEKSNALARQVYERFLEASGTIASSANTFQDSVLCLQEQVVTFKDFFPQFKTYSQQLENGANNFKTASEKIEQSKFSENLEQITSNLAKTQTAFSKSTAFLGNNLGKIIDNNQKATELAQKIYSQLDKSSGKIQNSAIAFLEASEKIKQSQFADKLLTATADLEKTQNQFAQSTSVLNQSTQSVELASINLQRSVIEVVSLGEQIKSLNQRSGEIIELTNQKIAKEEDSLSHIQSELVKLIDSLKQYESQISSDLGSLGERLVESISQQVDNNNQQIQLVVAKLTQYINHLSETKFAQLVVVLEQSEKKASSDLHNLGNRFVESFSQEVGTSNKQVQILVGKIETYASELSKLFNILKDNQKELNKNFQSLSDRLKTVMAQEDKRKNDEIKTILQQIDQSVNQIKELNFNFANLTQTNETNRKSSDFPKKSNNKS